MGLPNFVRRTKKNQKGQDRTFSSPSEINAALAEIKKLENVESSKEESSTEDETTSDSSTYTSQSETDSSSSESSTDDSDDESTDEDESDDEEETEIVKSPKQKGVQGLIETINPNHSKQKYSKRTDVDKLDDSVNLSRRDREQLNRQHCTEIVSTGSVEDENLVQKVASDLERLAIVRKQRELDAAKRLKEEEKRKKAIAAKTAKMNDKIKTLLKK
ncbi:hypothetical protein RDWZM_007850 [Blomia tropicalis]|uniref:Casein kinase substrate phosphoprotein PP28 domain-containing protein n=1 Tax=Blomia tropicalis TaxID=40697 RepID=A0A9Q0LY84_BLOTA|nr:hypothetical protein RDWZM_007850 [Blomia tropicalis]